MPDEHWLEASLIVDGEMAEAVSDVMTRYVSGGVVIESTQISYETNAQGEVAGPLRVCGYLRVTDNLEDVKQNLLEGLWHLGQIREIPPVKFKPVAEVDWTEVWKRHFHPVPIGERLLIGPTWIEFESESRLEIKLDPGMAFGTGTHPTTQLCLEILEDLLEGGGLASLHQPSTRLEMIDVGCGSGILGIAAIKLGVNHVLGVDQDEDAIEVARQNSAINGVEKKLELSIGSLSEILSGEHSIREASLVTVNILAPVILKMLEAGLNDLVASQGFLVLSGILDDQAEEVEAALRRSGMRIEETRQRGDWRAYLVEKSS